MENVIEYLSLRILALETRVQELELENIKAKKILGEILIDAKDV
jgi:hypothetical protein